MMFFLSLVKKKSYTILIFFEVYPLLPTPPLTNELMADIGARLINHFSGEGGVVWVENRTCWRAITRT